MQPPQLLWKATAETKGSTSLYNFVIPILNFVAMEYTFYFFIPIFSQSYKQDILIGPMSRDLLKK